MFLSVENGDRGKLFDCHGVEILNVMEADTETGNVTVYLRDAKGGFFLNAPRTEAAKETRRFDPLLRFQPEDK